MEYQKIKSLLDNTANQPSKFKTKNWVEINDYVLGVYSTNGQVIFEGQVNIKVKFMWLKEP